jgi:hypothetical protein
MVLQIRLWQWLAKVDRASIQGALAGSSYQPEPIAKVRRAL